MWPDLVKPFLPRRGRLQIPKKQIPNKDRVPSSKMEDTPNHAVFFGFGD